MGVESNLDFEISSVRKRLNHELEDSLCNSKKLKVMDMMSTVSSDSISSSMGMDCDAHCSLMLTLSPPVTWLAMYIQPRIHECYLWNCRGLNEPVTPKVPYVNWLLTRNNPLFFVS